MFRWIGILAGLMAGLVAVAWIFGMTRPRSHVARTMSGIAAEPEQVWEMLADFERWSEWNPEVEQVVRLAETDGHGRLRTVASWGEMDMEVTVFEPPARLQTSVSASGFSGRWTYELQPGPAGGTTLTITEEGDVGNPLLRAIMIFHDNYASMIAFHEALGSRLGQQSPPVRVEPTG